MPDALSRRPLAPRPYALCPKNATPALLAALCAGLALCAAPAARADEERERPRFRLDLGGGIDSFSKNYSDPGFGHHREGAEESGFLQIGYRFSPALTLTAGGDLSTPLQHTEGRVNAGVYYGLSERLTFNASAAFAPDRHVVARWDLLAGLDWQALPWLGVLATVRHLDFPSDVVSGLPSGHDAVTTFSAGLRLDALPRTTLTAQGGLSHHTGLFTAQGAQETIPQTAFGSAKVEVALPLPLDLGASVGLSRGAESRRPFNPGLTSAVTAVTAGLRWQVTEAWGVRVDYLHESFEDEYLRDGVSSALTVKF